ncbi:hypothetical protein IHQ71_28425 [Rhizobium sp. TH2]|uniref:hypothetical protein n=1 Tax=Rhizobium sp. TH2 TaxID=2775403 RepID=UPI002157B18D|nr:hypothetical protein [Rhizobium sp. TH2]UVC08991.1 hypothetical protein IHQ71_28425 [Rhizobium sp. TH2]
MDRTTKRIRKLYRHEGRAEQHCRDVFDSEWQALTIASCTETLGKFVIAPIFRVGEYEVIDVSGQNITGDFLEKAGFEGAFIDGTFEKIAMVDAPNKGTLTAALLASGISHFIDASVTLDGNGNIEKIIDIGMRDIVLEWE